MSIVRRSKYFPPATVTISFTIFCEENKPPRFIIGKQNDEMYRKKSENKNLDLFDLKSSLGVLEDAKNSDGFNSFDADKMNRKNTVIVRKKKKKKNIERKIRLNQNEDAEPIKQRYRIIQDSSINMYIELEKQNIGEFVWDQQCTRIDAIVAPMPELNRTTTPEVPILVDILP